jgi:hypothetical protein
MKTMKNMHRPWDCGDNIGAKALEVLTMETSPKQARETGHFLNL